jgi:segregation and condensation protein B
VTYVVTAGFLDHFGLESARDLPGLKELRAAGLLESRPAMRFGAGIDDDDDDLVVNDDGQEDMFQEGDDP